MQTAFIVIRVAVSSGTRIVNQFYVIGVYNWSIPAVEGRNWRCRAAHVHSRVHKFVITESVRRGIIPFLAGSKASDSFAVLNDPQIAQSVGLRLRTGIE